MRVEPINPLRIFRLPELMERVGLRRSAIYAAINAGSFPAPLALSSRAVGWNSAAVDEWIRTRPNADKTQSDGLRESWQRKRIVKKEAARVRS